ncbi:hypothetical protein PC123_g2434 [Phytophthora cactorum]|nr:hypothetical protein PC123_g2434 [Phytophthora cactorum]
MNSWFKPRKRRGETKGVEDDEDLPSNIERHRRCSAVAEIWKACEDVTHEALFDAVASTRMMMNF